MTPAASSTCSPKSTASAADGTDAPPAAEPPAAKRAARKSLDPSHLKARETVLVRHEVLANSGGCRELDRIVTDRLDSQPSRILVKRLVRVVHIAVSQPDAVPFKVAARAGFSR